MTAEGGTLEETRIGDERNGPRREFGRKKMAESVRRLGDILAVNRVLFWSKESGIFQKSGKLEQAFFGMKYFGC